MTCNTRTHNPTYQPIGLIDSVRKMSTSNGPIPRSMIILEILGRDPARVRCCVMQTVITLPRC